ncbi:hypothetical protein BHE74_00051104 [Ensete ventricosum]|uniref:Uncharacterized protein n=1 Tax=Ensete ventricosum TaxID=4639 RepID=A0A426YPF4_ENSVE|nr:hypothetical protein B296_00049759 [Ensete ventricosum]RWW08795.1 hypothetical protein GW17_00027735 [Ensete ventricosum]RWW43269.1 hypothetical protein BHE74_00051104 [Ensete ventricosum]RZS23089.1 hypothetical protein BHM03_00055960 [Ensete ventricosum]
MENMNSSEALFDNSDVEDEFQSCCTEDEEWQDTEESLAEGFKDDLDELSLRMFFKGVSASDLDSKESRVSGIGVVMERSHGIPLIQVQKKLDFHVEALVAEHLALMDGLLAALQNGARRLYAFTDSEKVYYQARNRLTKKRETCVDCNSILCGHEFCYLCGAEYRNGIQTCQCAFWGENSLESSAMPNQESELWTWESFDSLPTVMDEYSEQERAQLALIQRFLAGGFSLSEHHHPSQSPPRCSDSYMDTMRDLHQLPWLERFVSVISDSYHEDFVQ